MRRLRRPTMINPAFEEANRYDSSVLDEFDDEAETYGWNSIGRCEYCEGALVDGKCADGCDDE